MKKEYIQPEMKVVKLQYSGIICMSQVSSVRSNLGDDDFLWGEGCDEDAR